MRGAAAAKTAEATTERGAHGRRSAVPLRAGRYAPAVTPRPLRPGPCRYAPARAGTPRHVEQHPVRSSDALPRMQALATALRVPTGTGWAAPREVERRPATHTSARYGAPTKTPESPSREPCPRPSRVGGEIQLLRR